MVKIKQSILAIVIGLALAASISFAAGTWSNPTANPTGGNTEAPINVGESSQYKEGALGIEGVLTAYNTSKFSGLATFYGKISVSGVGISGSALTVGGSGGSFGSAYDTVAAPTNGLIVEGNVGVGTASPTEKLEVSGKTKTTTLQVTDGAATGKVLTSDSTGNATWQTPEVSSSDSPKIDIKSKTCSSGSGSCELACKSGYSLISGGYQGEKQSASFPKESNNSWHTTADDYSSSNDTTIYVICIKF